MTALTTPRARRREEIRSKVRDEAGRLFAEKGYSATSPQDIADASGLTRQAFYYYGFTKDGLLLEIIEGLTTRTSLRLRASITDVTDYAKSLHDLVFLLVSDRANNRATVQLLLRSESEMPPSLSDSYASARDDVIKLVREVIEAGIASGQFRPVDSTIAVRSVIGMSDSVAWWFEPKPDSPVEPIAEEMARNAVEMLRAHPA